MAEETLVVDTMGMVAEGREAAIVEAAAMAMTVVNMARKVMEAAAMGTEATRLAARKEGVQEAVEVAAAQAVAEMAEGRVVRLVAHMEVVQGAGLEDSKVAGEAVAEEMAAAVAAVPMAETLAAVAAVMQASHEYTPCRSSSSNTHLSSRWESRNTVRTRPAPSRSHRRHIGRSS